MADRTVFYVLVVLSQVFGLLAVSLMAYWINKYKGGFEWQYKSPHKFNFHPFFMTLGLVFLYGDAILTYRVFRSASKKITKFVHLFLNLVALVLSITAVTAVYTTHVDNGLPNLYSIHGWIGLSTVIMFGLQFFTGLILFLVPSIPEKWKRGYLKLHRYWGTAIFAMAVGCALMGLAEKGTPGLTQRDAESYTFNFCGVALLLFGWAVTYIVSNPDYARSQAIAHQSLND